MRTGLHRKIGGLVAATALALPAGAAADQLFAPDSFWNSPLPASVDLDGGNLASRLQAQVQLDENLHRGPWINIGAYSTPLYVVGPNVPGQRVQIGGTNLLGPSTHNIDPNLEAALSSVPIPPGARAASGTDGTLTVWQPSTDTMWDLGQATHQFDGWHAYWGGRLLNVSGSPGFYQSIKTATGRVQESSTWGGSATNLPSAGGLIRPGELSRGEIDHALAIGVPLVRSGQILWPAQHTDGNSTDANAIPEGARFRIDPSLDLTTLNLPAPVLTIARAAQRYGMVVRDRSGVVTFYAEDPASIGSDPYPSLLGTDYPDHLQNLMSQFPWSHVQAFSTSLSSSIKGGPRPKAGHRRIVVATVRCSVACHLVALSGVAHSGHVTVPVRELPAGAVGTKHTIVVTLPRVGAGRRLNATVRITASGAAQYESTAGSRVTLRLPVTRKASATSAARRSR